MRSRTEHRHVAAPLVFMSAVLTLSAAASAQTTWHVDDDNCPGPGTGSEIDPFCSIQDAIDASADGDEVVALPGVYFEAIDFLGRAITLRSADGPEVTVIYGGIDVLHVVKCVSGEGADTILQGFTITEGQAGGPSETDRVGGGMLNLGSSPTVTGCIFEGNEALHYGGGMYNENSSPAVTACTFIDNGAAFRGGGMYNLNSAPTVADCTFVSNGADTGGGMHNLNSTPTVSSCAFSDNSASYYGGGMYNDDSNPIVVVCTFDANTADYGGAMANFNSSDPAIDRCAFRGNTADIGGGMRNGFSSDPTVSNCLFAGNAAISFGGAIANSFSSPAVSSTTFAENTAGDTGDGIYNTAYSEPTVYNCILWTTPIPHDPPQQIFQENGTSFVRYCDVQGGYSGIGNIGANPVFVDPDGADDDPMTFSDNDFRLAPGSPCIDTGNNWGAAADVADLDADGDTCEMVPFDLDGNHRFVDDPGAANDGCAALPTIIDMGAYEHPGNGTGSVLLADVNGDGVVNTVDLLDLLANWGYPDGPCGVSDLDMNGIVATSDLLTLLAAWGDCP